MWEKLVQQLPISLVKVFGFYNVQNENCDLFMNKLHANRLGKHSLLNINRERYDYNTKENSGIFEITQDYIEFFESLHQVAFKQAYFSAANILQKIDKDRKLFIAAEKDLLLGYVYC